MERNPDVKSDIQNWLLKLILCNYVPHDQLNSNTIFRWQLFPFLIKLSMSNFLSAARVIKPRALSVAMMSVAPPPLHPHVFTQDRGRGRPGPALTSYYSHRSVGARLSGSEHLCDVRRDHTLWHCSVSSSMKMGSLSIVTGVCLNINILVWGELLKSPSVNPWDVFLVVISPWISSIYYCFSIEHSNCHSVDDDTGLLIEVADIISELLNSVTAVAQVTPAVL